MDKQALKKALLEMERENVVMLEADYHAFIKGTLLNREDVIDTDDQSHHRESIDIGVGLDEQVHMHSKHMDAIQRLSFAPSEIVEPGAVIKLKDRFLVIAAADGQFEFDGKHFMSVSTKAPIYQCLKGKKANDVCTFNQYSFVIDEVY